jgi:hypothetical protein
MKRDPNPSQLTRPTPLSERNRHTEQNLPLCPRAAAPARACTGVGRGRHPYPIQARHRITAAGPQPHKRIEVQDAESSAGPPPRAGGSDRSAAGVRVVRRPAAASRRRWQRSKRGPDPSRPPARSSVAGGCGGDCRADRVRIVRRPAAASRRRWRQSKRGPDPSRPPARRRKPAAAAAIEARPGFESWPRP